MSHIVSKIILKLVRITYVQDDVAVPVIERAITLFGPFCNSKLLDPPYLSAYSLSCGIPRRLFVSGVLSDLFLELRAEDQRCELT